MVFWLTSIFAAALLLLALLSLLERAWWGFALLVHPRPHFALGLLVAAVVLWSLKRRRAAVVLLMMVVAIFWLVIAGIPEKAPGSPRGSIAIVHMNLDRGAVGAAAIERYITGAAIEPSLVCLQELTPAVADELAKRNFGYELVAAVPRDDSRGVGVLVRQGGTLQVESHRVLQWLPDEDRPTLVIEVRESGGLSLTVLSFHSKRPQDAVSDEIQRREFTAAAAWVRSRPADTPPLIVIGDFNTTPWSRRYRQFVERAGLRHIGGGMVFGGTFPSWSPALRLPIDLCAASPGVDHFSVDAGDDLGSDHLPLAVSVHPVPYHGAP